MKMRVILNGILLVEPEPALHPALPGIALKYHDGEFKFYDSNLPNFVFFGPFVIYYKSIRNVFFV